MTTATKTSRIRSRLIWATVVSLLTAAPIGGYLSTGTYVYLGADGCQHWEVRMLGVLQTSGSSTTILQYADEPTRPFLQEFKPLIVPRFRPLSAISCCSSVVGRLCRIYDLTLDAPWSPEKLRRVANRANKLTRDRDLIGLHRLYAELAAEQE